MHGQGLHSEIDETSTCMHTDKKKSTGDNQLYGTGEKISQIRYIKLHLGHHMLICVDSLFQRISAGGCTQIGYNLPHYDCAKFLNLLKILKACDTKIMM